MSRWKRGRQYWSDFTVGGQRYRRRLRTTNLRVATRRERELIEEAGHGRLPPDEQGPKRLSDAIKSYLTAKRIRCSPRTIELEEERLSIVRKHFGDALGAELDAGGSSVRPAFHVTVEGETRELHPILRDDIYKIAAEALRNAFRHAHAGQVEVEIRYASEEFRLRVRDDGRGIDPAVLAPQGLEGHYGLRGMPERAALIGGKLAVWSEVRAGTEVELRLPASIVYASSPRRSWWSRRFAFKTPT